MVDNPAFYIPILLLGGVMVGIVSGIVGIGGGLLVIPLLVILFHYDQITANGTSIAMLLPPIGIGAFYKYYRSGNVNILAAALLAVGFAVGAYFGGWIATSPWMREHEVVLRRIFVAFLLYVAALMFFRSDSRVHAAAGTVGLFLAYALAWMVLRVLGQRWQRQFVAADQYRRRLDQESRRGVSDYQI